MDRYHMEQCADDANSIDGVSDEYRHQRYNDWVEQGAGTMYTLTKTYRTKTEAQQAIKAGEVLHIVSGDGRILDKANGDAFTISGRLDHYKEWTGKASVWNGIVERIK
jgi:hypothetical protein